MRSPDKGRNSRQLRKALFAAFIRIERSRRAQFKPLGLQALITTCPIPTEETRAKMVRSWIKAGLVLAAVAALAAVSWELSATMLALALFWLIWPWERVTERWRKKSKK